MDIILCFRKAYLRERSGQEVRDPKLIAKQYLKFYFWIDTISAIPFDLFLNDNYFLRMASMLKIFRLFRLQKIVSFMNFDTQTRAKIRVMSLIIALLTIIHWVTCYWYTIIHDSYYSELEKYNAQVPVDQRSKYLPYNFNYWIPQVDLNDMETNYYDRPVHFLYF